MTNTNYTMKFYDRKGNTIGEVANLTLEQVDIIYEGCIGVLAKETGRNFNTCMPTVWREDGKRVMGY